LSRAAHEIYLIGEGPNDIGDLAEHPSYRDGREGFIQPILKRLAPECLLKFDGQKVTTLPRRPSARAPGHGRKAGQALVLAWNAGAEALVFVKDTDGGGAKSVRADIERGFAEARKETPELGDVVALCATPSDMIEAWALGDRSALATHAGRPPSQLRYRDPETLTGDERDPDSNHPKRVLERALGRRATSADFALLAETADPDVLRKTCPQSFPPFANSVASAVRKCEPKAEAD
jgi:hypothetical protein